MAKEEEWKNGHERKKNLPWLEALRNSRFWSRTSLEESSVARVLAENLISPRPRGSREAWFRHPRFLHPRSETSSLAPTAIAFTKRLASPPLPPPRSRQALTAREGANRAEGSAPLSLGLAGPGARELAREEPCCISSSLFVCIRWAGGSVNSVGSGSSAQS